MCIFKFEEEVHLRKMTNFLGTVVIFISRCVLEETSTASFISAIYVANLKKNRK